MKIRTRLYFNFTLIFAMLGVLFGMTLYSGIIVASEMEKLKIALTLTKKGSNLVLITNSYMVRHYAREKEQWDLEYRSMTELLKKTDDPEFTSVVAALASLKTSFISLGEEMQPGDSLIKNKSSASEIERVSRLNRLLLGQINFYSEVILSKTFGIAIRTDEHIRSMRKTRNLIMSFMTLGVIIVIFINSRITIAKITAAVPVLVAGARMIEQGIFSHRIKTGPATGTGQADDEIRGMAEAFNIMAERLEEYVLSLRNEVNERTKAEKELASLLSEKDVLLKEVHHRVKNNMQVISSLLNLQCDYLVDENDRELFNESQNRVYSMALIHEMLYQSESLKEIDFREFIIAISDELKRTYSDTSKNITISISSTGFPLELFSAVPCALIINELISNSFKHAFEPGQSGKITIDLSVDRQNRHVICYRDSGRGISDKVDIGKKKTLGLQLIHSLTSQLKGSLEISRNEGAEFLIVF